MATSTAATPAMTEESYCRLEEQVLELKKQLAAARRALGEMAVRVDYAFAAWDGRTVRLTELFGDKDDLLVVHNMGRHCAFCTLWADGFNGIVPHLEDRCAFAVVSNDPPDVQREFAESRGWRFRMVSSAGTSFFADMGFLPKPDQIWPGASAFHRDRASGTITRTAKTFFGPGDDFCALWHLFDMLHGGANGWRPRLAYAGA